MSLQSGHTFLNQDVVYAIFEHFAVPDALWYDYDTATRSTKSADDTEERRDTLARCARVCRAFLFPAVSILWRNPDSLETLSALSQRHASQKAEVSRTSWLTPFVDSLTASLGSGCRLSRFVMATDLRSVLPLGTRCTQSLDVPGPTIPAIPLESGFLPLPAPSAYAPSLGTGKPRKHGSAPASVAGSVFLTYPFS